MISHYFYQKWSHQVRLFTNRHPEYLFDDYPSPAKLYGRGFTVYGQLPCALRSCISVVDPHDCLELVGKRYFSKIVWTSVRRFNTYLLEAIASGYSPADLIVVDGEDDSGISVSPDGVPLTSLSTYYKRELDNAGVAMGALPISFKFPAVNTIWQEPFPQKTVLLAGCDPRLKQTYVYKDQKSYYLGYQSSLFAFTTQKAGWDCLRHYEILANNCLPVFPDILGIPEYTMVAWPRGLQLKVNSLWSHVSCSQGSSISGYLPCWEELMVEFREVFLSSMLTSSYEDLFV
jgi:hypothetical protein